MLSFRQSISPTHTVDTDYGFTEAFLLAVTDEGTAVWLTEEKEIHLAQLRKPILIPGCEPTFSIDRDRVSKQSRIPMEVLCSTNYILELVTNQWRSTRSPSWSKVRIIDGNRIVRKNAKPWIIRSRAERTLNELHLRHTHIVKGYGNNGPRGREWWIEPKYNDFHSVNYLPHSNLIPFDEFNIYSLEIMFNDNLDTSTQIIDWELRQYRKHWNYVLRRDTDCITIGFEREMDYMDFVNYVVCKMSTDTLGSSNEYAFETYTRVSGF